MATGTEIKGQPVEYGYLSGSHWIRGLKPDKSQGTLFPPLPILFHQTKPLCSPRALPPSKLMLILLFSILLVGIGGCSLFKTAHSPYPDDFPDNWENTGISQVANEDSRITAEEGNSANGEPAAQKTSTSNPASSPDDGGMASLGGGDVITVKVFREPELSGDYLIGNDGNLSFPLVGKVQATGLTPSQLADRLGRLLGECCLRDPSVSILVKEYTSKMVHVFGQVQKPGSFPYQENMTVVQAITLSGGFTKTAWQSKTTITRRSGSDGAGKRLTIPIDAILQGKRQNVNLKPGDIIFVPESLF